MPKREIIEYLIDSEAAEAKIRGRESKRKHLFVALLVGILFLLTLFGCTSNSSSSSSPSPAPSMNSSNAEEDDSSSASFDVSKSEENVVKEEWLTLNQVISNRRFYAFIQKGDLFNPIAADNTYERSSLLVDYKSNESDPDNIIPVIDPSTERIALSNYSPQEDTFAFMPITRTAYFGNYPTEIYSCDEIDGIDVNALEGESVIDKIINYMHSIGIETPFSDLLPSSPTPVSEVPTEFTIGYYQGTKWFEETIEVSIKGFDIDSDNPIELPVEKTKDGYFFVDISSLDSGKYAIKNGNTWHSQVNGYSVIEVA